MRYLEKSFSVPVAGPNVTEEEWAEIFGKKPGAPPVESTTKKTLIESEKETGNTTTDAESSRS